MTGVQVPREGASPVDVLRERLEFVLESASMGVWDLDIVADRTVRSLRHDQCFGYDALLPRWSYEDFVVHLHPDDRPWVEQAFQAAMHGGGEFDVEFRVRWPDGSEHWLVSRGRFVHDEDGMPVRVGGVVGDVSARKQAELAALEAVRRLDGLVDSMGDAVVTSTLSGVVLSWNPAAETLFGWTAHEMIGRDAADAAAPDHRDEVSARRSTVAQGVVVPATRAVRRRRDGSDVDVEVTLSPLRGADGEVVGTTAVIRDITRQVQLERDLERQALHDALTGLPNRVLLADRLERAIRDAERGGTTVAVLVLDLDGFKVINDAAGHALGDHLLVEAASRLRACLRPSDTVARSGGDEFVVVCERTGVPDAMLVAQRVHDALAPAMELEGRRFYVTASVGVAVSPPLAAEVLLRSADMAMYDAKSSGRSRTSMFLAPMAQRLQDQMELSGELREALAADALQVHYQPLVDLATGRLIGIEALARWSHPERGAVAPNVFVAVAEATGLITALDTWVLGRACRDGAALVAEGVLGPGEHVAVNIGARDVSDGTVVAMVVEAVTSAGPGFGYDRLVVEITETGVLTHPARAHRALLELCELGVRVALDDFGTGYSSLTHLQQLPISVLKVDQSFVHRIAGHAGDAAIVGSIVQLAAVMGMRMVAEGVELPEQRALLQQLGCAAGQGWLWGPALPLPELRSMLAGLPDGRFDVGTGSAPSQG